MRLKGLFAACLLVLAAACNRPFTSFEIRDGHFWLNGDSVRVLAGEMHYPRIPHEYWRHRIQMARALGLNAISTYVFWNCHEPEPDVWDFSGDHDVAAFIRTCAEEGMMVILRPGPYVCAEWDYGGFPWWLQNIDSLQVRQYNKPYLDRVRNYFEHLYAQVGDLQITHGGPIIMVQCENEFGSFYRKYPQRTREEHRAYMEAIRDQLREVGFDVPMYTADGSLESMVEGGHVDGALCCVNGEYDMDKFYEAVNRWSPGGPYFAAEFYPGWLMHWAEEAGTGDTDKIAEAVERYLADGASICLYMVHGGTNFGFTSGANYNKTSPFLPDLTSYDYAAPISEAGWSNPRFDRLQEAFAPYVKGSLPEPPARIPVIAIPGIRMERSVDVLSYLEGVEPVCADRPLTFEEMNQGHGYMLYSRRFEKAVRGVLNVPGLRDYANVFIDGEPVGELNRVFGKFSMPVNIPAGSTLQLLVENWGRINFDIQILDNHKGIVEPVTLGLASSGSKSSGTVLEGGWEMRPLPMDAACLAALTAGMPAAAGQEDCASVQTDDISFRVSRPAVYAGTFKLEKTGDTFLDMSHAGKGIVFINGRNLGRYWLAGPQQTLYVPGVWLREGTNEILVFDQMGCCPSCLQALEQPILYQMGKVSIDG